MRFLAFYRVKQSDGDEEQAADGSQTADKAVEPVAVSVFYHPRTEEAQAKTHNEQDDFKFVSDKNSSDLCERGSSDESTERDPLIV
jgi:hypothetical protein